MGERLDAPGSDFPLPETQPEIYIQPVDSRQLARPWVALGASVQGSSHLRAAQPCQDAHAYRILKGGAILAVADGLGSAQLSGIGAELAARRVVDHVAGQLERALPRQVETWQQLLRQGFAEARAALETTAEQNISPLRAYGTTLLVAVLAEDWLATGHIGDGAAVAALESGELLTVCAPQNTEYINETFSLAQPEALAQAEFAAQPGQFSALALFSDGLQQLALVGLRPHLPFFTPLFQQLPKVSDPYSASHKLGEFLASERVCARTDDDKTLLLAGRV